MPPRKPAQAQTQNHVSRRLMVVIKRDQTTETPRVIWAHEFAILEAIFGEGNVKDTDPASLNEGFSTKASPDLMPYNKRQDPISKPSRNVGIGYVFVGDPRAEYERLADMYGMHPEVKESWVQHVYGRFQDGRFETVLGHAGLEDMPDAQLRDLIISQGYLPLTDLQSTPEQRAEAEQKRAELMRMPAESLIELARQYSSEFEEEAA